METKWRTAGLSEFVVHLNRQGNEWPDSAFGGMDGTLAGPAQHGLFKTICEERVIWAHAKAAPTDDGGVALESIVFTEAYVLTDNAGGPAAQGLPCAGTTQVIPLTELTGLTLRDYWA